MVYIVEEHLYLYAYLGVAIGFGFSSSINSSDGKLGCELLPLSQFHLIEDEALRFYHVAREEEVLRDRVRPIENHRLRCRHTSIEVHHMYLTLAVISLKMNG